MMLLYWFLRTAMKGFYIFYVPLWWVASKVILWRHDCEVSQCSILPISVIYSKARVEQTLRTVCCVQTERTYAFVLQVRSIPPILSTGPSILPVWAQDSHVNALRGQNIIHSDGVQ